MAAWQGLTCKMGSGGIVNDFVKTKRSYPLPPLRSICATSCNSPENPMFGRRSIYHQDQIFG